MTISARHAIPDGCIAWISEREEKKNRRANMIRKKPENAAAPQSHAHVFPDSLEKSHKLPLSPNAKDSMPAMVA